MSRAVTVGVDIGTSSSKGVLVTTEGDVLATATREHAVDRPQPGFVEMDAHLWWDEFASICHELLASPAAGDVDVVAVGVSGMGPCVLVADEAGEPLRPAILYGIDTRATVQIERLSVEFGGADAIRERCGSALSTQAVGPKLAWLAENEPRLAAASRRLFMPSSWLGFQLTGAYYLDHHSASQCTPLHDASAQDWIPEWVQRVAPWIELPRLLWPGEVAGRVTPEAASRTGLPVGTPVIAGTIDAWSEALSVGAQNDGDLMLMYGTTMFLVNTVPEPVTSAALWGTVGALHGTHNLAGGMATSGAITAWLRELFGSPGYPELIALAEQSPAGAGGLLLLPYFAGERTPIADPDARGIIAGLTVSHTRGDLYRAALEATAFGVRHNIEVMEAAGGRIDRIVAVGGGAQGTLWTQIVSDVTGRPQAIPSLVVGASLGAAFLAAAAVGPADIGRWNPVVDIRRPNLEVSRLYDELYGLYRGLYERTAETAHALAELQRRSASPAIVG